jgi:hypothetical protein
MSLNPKSYKLSGPLLDEMIAHDWKTQSRKFENHYDETKTNISPADFVHAELGNLNNILSEPLKMLHAEYLSKTVKTCYPTKHLTPDFTNEEQIELCR